MLYLLFSPQFLEECFNIMTWSLKNNLKDTFTIKFFKLNMFRFSNIYDIILNFLG